MKSIAAKVALSALASGLVVDAASFWSDAPAVYSDIIRTAYPVGNGRLGGSYSNYHSTIHCISDRADECANRSNASGQSRKGSRELEP